MTEADKEMAFLNSLFAEEAQNANSGLDEALMARIVADALAEQPRPHLAPPARPWWQQLTSLIGGWQAVGGLVAATCTGLWFGMNPPQSLSEPLQSYLNLETNAIVSEFEEDTFSHFNWDIEENAL